MAYVSLTPSGKSLVASAKNLASNMKAAFGAGANEIKSDLNGDFARIANGSWITDSSNTPLGPVLNSSKAASSSYSYGGSGSGGGGGYGGGGGSVSDAPATENDIMKLISDTARANNEWSAAQAQKQMDFQREMSDTAHQREVKDLQAAGLNPVLSAGGNGASTPSGAMGDTDTSNTRLMAEIAMEAVSALGNTAGGYAGAVKANADGSFLGKLSNLYSSNKLFRQVVNTGLSVGKTYLTYRTGGSAFARAFK